MLIGGLQKLTLIDYPSKLACTVFCAGCNFRCPFCYNSDLVLPEKIREQLHPPQVFARQKFGRAGISEKDFFDFLEQRKGLLEGVCITGGEPTISSGLFDFCQNIKKLGYFIKLDTNGSNPTVLKELIEKEFVDYVALDIKAPPKKYGKVIGIDSQLALQGLKKDFWLKKILENIEKTIEILKQGKIDYEFRTTCVPKLLTKKDILTIARWLVRRSPRGEGEISPAPSASSGQAPKYYLQNFQPKNTIDPKFEKVKPHTSEDLLEIQKAIAPFFETCQIRG